MHITDDYDIHSLVETHTDTNSKLAYSELRSNDARQSFIIT